MPKLQCLVQEAISHPDVTGTPRECAQLPYLLVLITGATLYVLCS